MRFLQGGLTFGTASKRETPALSAGSTSPIDQVPVWSLGQNISVLSYPTTMLY